VKYRDIRYVTPFLIQFWLFATPIAYSSSLLDPRWRAIYAINPMVGVVEGFRWALLATKSAPGPVIVVSSVAALIFLITGLGYFRATEKTFADIV
jgi:lipopolysaccharide transport system permease protein